MSRRAVRPSLQNFTPESHFHPFPCASCRCQDDQDGTDGTAVLMLFMFAPFSNIELNSPILKSYLNSSACSGCSGFRMCVCWTCLQAQHALKIANLKDRVGALGFAHAAPRGENIICRQPAGGWRKFKGQSCLRRFKCFRKACSE